MELGGIGVEAGPSLGGPPVMGAKDDGQGRQWEQSIGIGSKVDGEVELTELG